MDMKVFSYFSNCAAVFGAWRELSVGQEWAGAFFVVPVWQCVSCQPVYSTLNHHYVMGKPVSKPVNGLLVPVEMLTQPSTTRYVCFVWAPNSTSACWLAMAWGRLPFWEAVKRLTWSIPHTALTRPSDRLVIMTRDWITGTDELGRQSVDARESLLRWETALHIYVEYNIWI